MNEKRTLDYSNFAKSPQCYIVGIDPGKSTGISILYVDVFADTHLECVKQGSPEVALDVLHGMGMGTGLSRETRPILIACERFLITQKTAKSSQQTDALETIGAIKNIARQNGCNIVMQGPGPAKRFAPNRVLKAMGFHKTAHDVGQSDANDANDATRHALLMLGKFRPVAYGRLLRRAGLVAGTEGQDDAVR